MPTDDVNFQRFRYSTEEEEPAEAQKAWSLCGGIPRSFDPETVIVPLALQDRQSSAWVRTDGLIAQKYD
jgi:hypothetical protein